MPNPRSTTTTTASSTPPTYHAAVRRAATSRTSTPPRYEVNVEVSHDVFVILVVIAAIIVSIAFCSKALRQCRERRRLTAKQAAESKKQTRLDVSTTSTAASTDKASDATPPPVELSAGSAA